LIPVVINNRTYLFPENWNELTSKQLLAISPVICKEALDYKDRLELFRVCLGMSRGKFLQYAYMPKWLHPKLWWKKAEVLLFFDRQLHWLDFLTNTNTLTNQLVPVIRYGFTRKKLFGPAANFENLRMDEFCFTEHHYMQFRKTKSREDLTRFVASIYRPAKKDYDTTLNPDGDIRIPFNEHSLAFFAKKIHRVSDRKLLAILHWYEGCRFQLVETFEKVFNGKESDVQSFGLFSLITGVAEDGVMGDFEKVNKNYVQVVLLRLTELINKAEYLERQLEMQKNKLK
jgi:hypothetical protein